MIAYQNYSVPKLQHLATTTHNGLGTLGEIFILNNLNKESGFRAWFPDDTQCGDIHAQELENGEVLHLEIKTARQTSRNRWNFCLVKSGENGDKTNATHSDIVILLPVLKSGVFVPFVIPIKHLGDAKSITIGHPLEYNGKFAKFRVRDYKRVGGKCWEFINDPIYN